MPIKETEGDEGEIIEKRRLSKCGSASVIISPPKSKIEYSKDNILNIDVAISKHEDAHEREIKRPSS